MTRTSPPALDAAAMPGPAWPPPGHGPAATGEAGAADAMLLGLVASELLPVPQRSCCCCCCCCCRPCRSAPAGYRRSSTVVRPPRPGPGPGPGSAGRRSPAAVGAMAAAAVALAPGPPSTDVTDTGAKPAALAFPALLATAGATMTGGSSSTSSSSAAVVAAMGHGCVCSSSDGLSPRLPAAVARAVAEAEAEAGASDRGSKVLLVMQEGKEKGPPDRMEVSVSCSTCRPPCGRVCRYGPASKGGREAHVAAD
jgi:hypothetical protein